MLIYILAWRKVATLERRRQTTGDAAANLHPSTALPYRVELVENFHQVLLQLHADLFALPTQDVKGLSIRRHGESGH